jgi:hypothetical protein
MTYKIKYEPVIVGGVERPKYNIHYSDGVIQFHSVDGVINGTERKGFANEDAPDWLALEQALFYSGLRQKAKESPNLNLFEFSSLIGAFGNGKKGEASENTLIYLLHAINADWDSDDVTLLNQLLEVCNFTIRYT